MSIVSPSAHADPEAADCVTCGAPLQGPFCHECGEEARAPDDLRVGVFVRRALAGVLDLDSRVWSTFIALVRRPGLLTAEFVRGRRRPWLHPLQTFLLANLVFFATLTSIGGFNTFTTELRYHVQQWGYGGMAERLVATKGEPESPEAIDYAARFDEATPRYANSMVILMAPVLAMFLALLYPRRRGLFVRHLVFSLHYLAFLLLVITALPLALRLIAAAAPAWFDRVSSSEAPVGLLLLTCCVLYLIPALHRVYDDGPATATLRALAGAALLLPALLVYRAILFFVVHLTID